MMIRKAFLVAVPILVLLIAAFVPLVYVLGYPEKEEGEFDITEVTDDFVVDYGETKYIEDEEWNMNASIYVYGTLYINNTKIYWGGVSDGEFGLYNHGNLYIDNDCNFTAQNKNAYISRAGGTPWDHTWGYHWRFELWSTSRIKNSSFSYIWGDTGAYLQNAIGGLQCYSDDIVIDNVIISNVEQCGISICDRSGSTTSGWDPTINRVTVTNTTGWGIFAGGSNANPLVTNSTFMGSWYRGGQYFYGAGASGRFENNSFLRNYQVGFIFDPINAAYMVARNCSFNENGNGTWARRGGGTTFYDCHFDRNRWYGVELAHDSGYSHSLTISGGTINENGRDGVGTTFTTSSAILSNVEIVGNGWRGVEADGPQVSVSIINCSVNNNMMSGIIMNNTVGAVIDSNIFDNPDGNVFISSGSTSTVEGNTIYNAPQGVSVTDSSPKLNGNTISACAFGITIQGESVPELNANTISSCGVGMYIKSINLTISKTNFTANGQGLIMEKVDGGKVRFCNFNGNGIGMKILGGDSTDIKNVSIMGSTTVGVAANLSANITMSGEMSGNLQAFSLDRSSIVMAYSISLQSSDVSILDARSELWLYWSVGLMVLNNLTLNPVNQANAIVYDQNGEVLMDALTFFDGWAQGWVPQYHFTNTQVTDFNPINITVTKALMVPYWGGPETLNADIAREILLADNRAPVFLELGARPVETHQNRPTLTWNSSYDWNSDVIHYRVNVYQDELFTGQQIVENTVVRDPSYQFIKNLRYNHEFWVEIVAYDPWGLSDTEYFTFRTFNMPPSTPIVALAKNPVSTRDDIQIVILNASTDSDVDPIDDITYLVEWYAFRENSWVLIQSGSNGFVLSANLTKENDQIKAVIKSYDGIEYGNPVTLLISVVNFVPMVSTSYMDIEMVEDTPATDLIDLLTLFYDEDGDDLSFNVKVQRHVSAEIDPVWSTITFIPDQDWMGKDYLIIEAIDPKPHNQDWPTIRINVTVSGVNDAPEIIALNDATVQKGATTIIEAIQGSSVSIWATAVDPDEIFGDTFEFSTNIEDSVEADLNDDIFQFESITGRMSLFLPNALVGTHEFNMTVTDESGDSSSVPLRLIVENKNDAPSIPTILTPTNGAVVVQEEGKEILFSAKGADDPDLLIPGSTETLEYDWDFGDSLGIRRNAGLNVNYSFKVEGEYTVTLTVRDKAGSFQETSINIVVNITREDRWTDPENEPTFLEEWGLILILVIVGIIVLAIILAFILRREPLAETAEAEEKAHEELVAKQQQEALAAQERLQTLLGGTFAQASGPALPAATGEQAGMEALPAAPPEVASPEPVPEPAPAPIETGEPVSFQPPPAPEPVPAEAPQPESPAPPEAGQEQYTYVPPPTEGQ